MDEGWIKLHRKTKNHWLYQEKPFDRYHAWEDILMSANHEQNTFLHGNTLLTIEPGQFVTSLRKLGERWGWSQEKVRRFLNLLVSDAMVRIECDTKKTVIAVENWDIYQTERNGARHNCDTNETPIETNKNEKNDKNTLSSQLAPGESDGEETEKRSKGKSPAFEHDHVAYKSAAYMAGRILKHSPGFPQLRDAVREQTIQRWSQDIDRLLRIDLNLKPGEINKDFRDVLSFSQTSPFWQKNILSGKKLREQYGALLVRIQEDNDG